MEIKFHDMYLVLGHAWRTAHATVSHSIAFRTIVGTMYGSCIAVLNTHHVSMGYRSPNEMTVWLTQPAN